MVWPVGVLKEGGINSCYFMMLAGQVEVSRRLVIIDLGKKSIRVILFKEV